MNYSNTRATKVGKKSFDADIEISRSSSRKIKRSMRKSSLGWFLALLVLVVGFAGGFVAHKLIFSKDVYEMTAYASGETDIFIGTSEENSTYTELGVKCVAFGKDYSKECTVTYYYRENASDEAVKVNEVDETKPGTYYAVYKTPAKKYSSVKLIRNIFVLREED